MLKPLTDVEATEARLGARHPFKGLGEPEDIAKAAVFLASDDASWITGVALPVDGKAFLDYFVVCGAVSLLFPRWLQRPVILPAYLNGRASRPKQACIVPQRHENSHACTT